MSTNIIYILLCLRAPSEIGVAHAQPNLRAGLVYYTFTRSYKYIYIKTVHSNADVILIKTRPHSYYNERRQTHTPFFLLHQHLLQLKNASIFLASLFLQDLW